jgi:hypothetical protein
MPFTTPTKSLAMGVDFVPPKNWDAALWKVSVVSLDALPAARIAARFVGDGPWPSSAPPQAFNPFCGMYVGMLPLLPPITSV